MKIGLLSDTHGYLDPKIFQYFETCDELWHAGDIGTSELLSELEAFKPIKSVYGNIDPPELSRSLPEDLYFTCEEMTVLISHIVGRPGKYNTRIKKIFKEKQPQIVVCGHSHMLKVQYDKQFNLLYLNPGACGRQGFHKVRTLLRFEINSGKAENMEAIELGGR